MRQCVSECIEGKAQDTFREASDGVRPDVWSPAVVV